MTAVDEVDVKRARIPRGFLPILIATIVAVVGFVLLSYAMSHFVLGYVTCDGPPPPPEAFDVGEGTGCWTYRLPWPEN